MSKPRRRQSDKPPVAGAVRGQLPDRQQPQLCTLATNAPRDAGWISEVKFDGYRLLVAVDGDNVRLLTRSGLDWTDRMPGMRGAIAALRLRSALLDGELVALDPNGVSNFPMLQTALKTGRDASLVYYVFDLLHWEGWDLRPCALLDRKLVLEFAAQWTGAVRYSSHHEGQAGELYRNACEMQLEGIVCKRGDRPYRSGRNNDWLKLKCLGREEFIVIGYSPPSGSRVGIGGLQLGYRDVEGNLHYAGGVGTGFDDAELRRLRQRLDAIQVSAPDALLVAGDPIEKGTIWVRPELVAEVKYTGWAGSGRVRHAVYLGLREDKPAAEVVRNVADPEAPRWEYRARPGAGGRKSWHVAVPPRRKP